MASRPVSRLLLLAALVAAILGCARVAAGSAEHENARAVISQATGELKVTNSRNGQAIFQASGLAPGRSVTGTVQLANTGSLAGALTLSQLDVLDQPGVNGGRLSDAVQLNIQDITGGSSIPVYGGQLRSVGTRPLGSLAPGQSRTYRFTASLPDSGVPASPTSGDNAFAGSGVSVRYAWTATAPGTTTPVPRPPQPDPAPPPPTGGTKPPAPQFWFRVNARQLLAKGRIDLLVSCARGCSLRASAKFLHVKGARVPRRSALLATPGRVGRLRLKLDRPAKSVLRRALQQRSRVRVKVRLMVIPVAAKSRTYTKTISVKRPKKRR